MRVDGERTTEDGVHAYCTLFDLHDIDQQPGTQAGGESPRDLLAIGACDKDHTRRGRGFDQRRQDIHDGRHQILVGVFGFGDLNLGRPGRLQTVDQGSSRAGRT